MLHRHALSITNTSHHRKNGRRNVDVMLTQSQAPKYQWNSQGQKPVPVPYGKITDHLCFK